MYLAYSPSRYSRWISRRPALLDFPPIWVTSGLSISPFSPRSATFILRTDSLRVATTLLAIRAGASALRGISKISPLRRGVARFGAIKPSLCVDRGARRVDRARLAARNPVALFPLPPSSSNPFAPYSAVAAARPTDYRRERERVRTVYLCT